MPEGRLIANLISVAGMALRGPALADNYPAKPLKLITPFPPGGTTDIVGRSVADQLSKVLGQVVVVESRGGGGRSTGADAIAKAALDGYTIGIATVSTHVVNPACNPKLPYDLLKDFKPIIDLATVVNVIVVNPIFPVKSYKESAAVLTANPGKYSFTILGTCSIGHMLGKVFKVPTKTQMVHVLYRGADPALNDVLANQVPIMVDNLPPFMQFIKNGKLWSIVVAQNKRIDSLPDVPTFAGVGLKDANDPAWYGLVTPAGTPDEVTCKLNEASVKVPRELGPAGQSRGAGAEPVGNAPQRYTAEIRREFEKMRTLVKQQNIKLEQ